MRARARGVLTYDQVRRAAAEDQTHQRPTEAAAVDLADSREARPAALLGRVARAGERAVRGGQEGVGGHLKAAPALLLRLGAGEDDARVRWRSREVGPADGGAVCAAPQPCGARVERAQGERIKCRWTHTRWSSSSCRTADRPGAWSGRWAPCSPAHSRRDRQSPPSPRLRAARSAAAQSAGQDVITASEWTGEWWAHRRAGRGR